MEDATPDVLSTISHDIRAPLGVLLVAVSELLDPALGPLTDEQRALVLLVRRSSERLSRLAANVYLLNRIGLGRAISTRQRMDARELATRVVEAFERSGEVGKLRVAVELPASRVDADIDVEAVTTAIVNVVANAIRFARSEVRLGVADTPAGAAIDVDDDGPGLSETPAESSGLGLRVARGVVGAHGGEVLLANRHDGAGRVVGAHVRVTLPGQSKPQP